MADYFSEYSSFVGAKGLPSPADTPYDTPGFLRSKRSSRATTAGSTRSREQSASPPPLPPDAVEYADKNRDGRYTALDPRRFTPTLHASLVSEILSLRRELDSKNHLVENLETSLASAKSDNETLSAELTTSAKEVRTAKQQVAQMESGTYEALEALVKERDNANASLQEMKARLEATQKKTRGHDEEAERTQTIWEREKEQWEHERRQLERRVHVTETRLRAFVDEVAAQQAASEAAPAEQESSFGDSGTVRDSGIGNESETTSLASPRKRHTRNVSSLSFKNGFRNSVFSRVVDSPEPSAKAPGHSLADELGIDEEEEDELEESDHEDDEDDELEYHQRPKHLQSRQGSMVDMDSKAKRILGLSDDLPVSPSMRDFPKDVSDEAPISPGLTPVSPQRSHSPQNHATATTKKVEYVDTGYQPSPPPSPAHGKRQLEPLQVPQPPRGTPTFLIDSGEPDDNHAPVRRPISVPAKLASSPISPPETPVVDGVTWPEGKKIPATSPAYSSASTQTEDAGPSLAKGDAPKRDSLQVPVAVPQIAIHPPTSRPSSPRTYALPPNTKNAGSQTKLRWPGKDASMQTEEIRIDQRPIKLPPHLLPSHLDELPEASVARKPAAEPAVAPKKPAKREAPRRQHISTNLPMLSSFPSPPMRSPTEASSPSHSRDGSIGGLGKMPLKAIPLPKPTLAPAISMDEVAAESSKGPLNRSSQFGVSQQSQANRQLAEIDDVSDISSSDDSEADDQAGSMPVLNAAGRLEGPDPLAFIPHDFANSPQRRPATADSYDAAPAPSIASSRNNSQRGVGGKRPPPSRSSAYLQTRARSPSFTSVASSNVSTQSALPPYAIPTRSSSRFSKSYFHSDDAQSPTPATAASRGKRATRGGHQRQGSLRKVQSAASMRGRANKMSPQKPRRRRRSPALTPVQSMAFESPAPTNFPIPELPTPLQQSLAFDWGKRPSSPSKRPDTAASSAPANEESQLVDSIAGTMVGEWMWKYMRKRKSFGAEAAETFSARNGEESNVGFTTHGTRHKRWVWLSPYERTIMWDSKQPSSASALQGKKGRKLTIQSVLDIADETPLPKKPELKTAFHRSILILTPSRALKFTAINAERHALWMSALSFLSETDQVQLPQLPLVPPIPDQYQNQPQLQRQRSPSFGRGHVRDSLRLAKGRQQPNILRSVSAQNTSAADIADIPTRREAPAPEDDDGADFPCIPRLYSNTTKHQRNRSNTSSSPAFPPPLSGLRSFSSTAIPSTASSNTRPNPGPSSSTRTHPNAAESSSHSGSRRPSEHSSAAAAAVGGGNFDHFNFFDAMPTVRMQAFVDPALKNGVLYVPPPPPMPAGPPPGVPLAMAASPRRRARGGSNLSSSSADKRRAGYVFDEDGLDPFKGF